MSGTNSVGETFKSKTLSRSVCHRLLRNEGERTNNRGCALRGQARFTSTQGGRREAKGDSFLPASSASWRHSVYCKKNVHALRLSHRFSYYFSTITSNKRKNRFIDSLKGCRYYFMSEPEIQRAASQPRTKCKGALLLSPRALLG